MCQFLTAHHHTAWNIQRMCWICWDHHCHQSHTAHVIRHPDYQHDLSFETRDIRFRLLYLSYQPLISKLQLDSRLPESILIVSGPIISPAHQRKHTFSCSSKCRKAIVSIASFPVDLRLAYSMSRHTCRYPVELYLPLQS